MENYRPINLPPIFGVIFERVICKSLFNYFLTIFSVTHFLLIPSQTTHQGICALPNSGQKIQTGFDSNLTNGMKSVLLEISKAFNKIWQDGLEFK